jgi:hypothetical protein
MAFAQAKPDFSGSWAPEVDAAAAGGGGGGGRGMMAGPMTVKQTADTLTVERSVGENKIVQVYKLDGSESVNKQMGRGGEVEIKSKAKFDGGKLVITSQRPGQDGAMVETTATWSVTGGVLTIENAGGRGPSKQTYKKTT